MKQFAAKYLFPIGKALFTGFVITGVWFAMDHIFNESPPWHYFDVFCAASCGSLVTITIES